MANKLIIRESDDAESLHNLLKDALSKEQRLIESSISRIQNELNALEIKYGMTTDQFIEQYSKGKTSDSLDFVDWSGLYHLYQKLLRKHVQIQDLQIVR